ncbi:MAG: hypothetical protein ACK4TA_14140 [Saprospiraceae bacterium]
MKQLEIDHLEALQGGIACSDVPALINWLYNNNYAQYLVIMDTFLHGGYTLQCTN